MRKLRQIFLTTLVLLCSALTSWAEPYTGGSETPSTISGGEFDGYYAIGTAAELYGFAALVNGGETGANAVLTADIVVNEHVLVDGDINSITPTHSWTPIGTSTNNYQGIFDANGRMVAKELATGTRTELTMQHQGLYIVRVGQKAQRVVLY